MKRNAEYEVARQGAFRYMQHLRDSGMTCEAIAQVVGCARETVVNHTTGTKNGYVGRWHIPAEYLKGSSEPSSHTIDFPEQDVSVTVDAKPMRNISAASSRRISRVSRTA